MYQRDRINRNKTEEDPSMWNWNEEIRNKDISRGIGQERKGGKGGKILNDRNFYL